jgi:hypothetical protein
VLGSSENNPAGNWVYHDVVVQNGRIYDSFTGPEGLSPEEYMEQFDWAEGIDFPFADIMPPPDVP